jgi:hypothetical protein
VELRPTNDFTQQKTDAAIRLAIARDLQRIWSDVLHEPLPTDLRRVIDKLEQVTGGDQRLGVRVPG